VACARRHFEVMFAKNAFNFYVKRAQVDSPWSGLLEAYSLRFPAGYRNGHPEPVAGLSGHQSH
jgi:hypothetical protein